jgi:tRNA pseudouridine55 synthase
MEGVLVIDKSPGLTSHDVVACARRLIGERRVGHTGTLDPLATGVLPLACGRATRLVRFLAASDKDYDATIRFGVTTDSYDISGTETSRSGKVPARDELIRAIESLLGDHLQTPPAFSAKKVGGRRAYDLARREVAMTLSPVPVRLARVELVELSGDRARVTLTCSAGFYVRAFAHTIGECLRTGACLEALRRTRSGDFDLALAVTLEAVQAGPGVAASRLVPLERLLPALPALRVTDEGRVRISHGRTVDSTHFVLPGPKDPAYTRSGAASMTSGARRAGPMDPPNWVRLFGMDGSLLALGTPAHPPGSLHPAVVLI